MTPHPAELIAVLEQMIDTGRALLDASKRKCAALAAMKLDLIQETTGQEEALTTRMHTLNERRHTLVSSLTGESCGPSGRTGAQDGSLGRLIERLPEPECTRLSVLRTGLAEVMRDLQFVNITNSIVSRRSLEHFREMLGVLSGTGPGDSGYDRTGRATRRLGPSALVNQTA